MHPVEIVARIERAFAEGRIDEIRSLQQAEVLYRFLGHPGRVFGREAAQRILVRAAEDVVFAAASDVVIQLGPDAAVSCGSIRFRMRRGGFRSTMRCTLYTFRDGLLYRAADFAGKDEAIAAYRELGPELGMAAEAPSPGAGAEPPVESARRPPALAA